MKEQFYGDLSQFILSVPLHNFLVVVGDFNARIGFDSHMTSAAAVGRYAYHDTTNVNGQKLAELCEVANLFSALHKQPHKRCHMWTWQHPNGAKAQLDHVLMRRRWINSLRNCRAYSSIEIDSDHRIVSATTKISLRVGGKKRSSGGVPNFETLANDNGARQEYSIQLSNRFSALESSDDCQVPTALR